MVWKGIYKNRKTNEFFPSTCRVDNCLVCPNKLQSKSGIVKSVLKDTTYKVDKGGIYVIQGICTGQYTGKTINFGNWRIFYCSIFFLLFPIV